MGAIFFSAIVFADVLATTDNGKRVLLKSDGTYEYVTKERSGKPASVDFAAFAIDSESFEGEKVTLKGSFAVIFSGGKISRAALYQDGSMVGPRIRVDTKGMSKSDQILIVKNCSPLCSAAISGTVENLKYGGPKIHFSAISLL